MILGEPTIPGRLEPVREVLQRGGACTAPEEKTASVLRYNDIASWRFVTNGNVPLRLQSDSSARKVHRIAVSGRYM